MTLVWDADMSVIDELPLRADFASHSIKKVITFTFVPFSHKELDHLKIATVTLSSFCRSDYPQDQDPEKIL